MAKILGVLGYLIASLWAAVALAQGPQNSVEAFNVSQQGGKVIIKLTLKDALKSQPGSFTVASPARIAIDLPNTVNNLGRNSQRIGEGELLSMNMVQAGERTRMVLNLRQLVSYDTQIDGKNLVVILASAPVASAGAAVTHFVEAKAVDTHAVRDIDFRRGKSGEGRIVVDLSDSSTGIDIRAQGQNLVIDFFKTALPDKLRQRLDVTDFGTPVQTINTFSQGDNVRMVITPKGLWEHSAYQTDNQFVVEVKQIVPDPNKLTQGGKPGFHGEKLSLNFQNVEVRSVLNVIADFTDLNIITSDAVGGNLTLRLKDVPWDQALQIILDTRGLDMRKNGNVIWIAPRDELATKEKLALESQQQIGELEAAAHRKLRAQLPEGGRRAVAAYLAQPESAVQARQRGGRCAHQHGVRAGRADATGGSAQADRADRRAGAPGDDRSAHRRGQRQLQQEPRREARLQRARAGRRLDRGTGTAHLIWAEPDKYCAKYGELRPIPRRSRPEPRTLRARQARMSACLRMA